jgi:hypothetical protein
MKKGTMQSRTTIVGDRSESETHAMCGLTLNLINAATTGNVDELAAIFDQKAVIWHYTNELTVTTADNLTTAAIFAANVPHRGCRNHTL